MILILLIIFIIIVIIYFSINNKNLCNKELTDEEYLKHMISHHEVAVYMSEAHINHTKNPLILNILRNVIRIQNFEINLMKDAMIKHKTNLILNDEMSNNYMNMNKKYLSTQGDYTYPNLFEISNTYCDPAFFHISDYKQLHNMSDKDYINHMIPHHQVAIDMSKRILKSSSNDFIIYLAYRIIRTQQAEIYELHNILNSDYTYNSIIL